MALAKYFEACRFHFGIFFGYYMNNIFQLLIGVLYMSAMNFEMELVFEHLIDLQYPTHTSTISLIC